MSTPRDDSSFSAPGSFSELGREVARALGDGPSADRLLRQRARLVEAEQRRARSTRWGAGYRSYAVLVASACAVVFGVWGVFGVGGWFGAEPRETLSASIDGQPLVAEAWVNAAEGPRALVFSEASSIVLAEGASARVGEVGERGLSLTLEQGKLDARITPETGYRWLVHAGPYRVQVLGTVFRVEWQPDLSTLVVSVSRGKVEVSGGAEGDAARQLVAGDSLTLSPAPRAELLPPGEHPGSRSALGSEPELVMPTAPESNNPAADAVNPSPDAMSPSPDAMNRASRREPMAVRAKPVTRPEASRVGEPAAPVTAAPVTAAPGASSSAGSAPGEWKTLANAGRYREAIEAAQGGGVGGILASASASDLLLLADAARLGGSGDLAERALLQIRARFPGHANSQVAAFSLGRLALEVKGDQREAVKWFRKYLAAGGSGPLAEGARGRLLTAYLKLGDRASARAAAEEYLRHHPKGRHATVARSLLD